MTAMRAPRRHELGERFQWLMQCSGMTGRAFTKALGETGNGIATKMKHGESLTIERLIATAYALAGRGQLIDDHERLFHFMVWGGDPRSVLRSQLQLVDGEQDDEDGGDGWVARESNPEPTDWVSVAPVIPLAARVQRAARTA